MRELKWVLRLISACREQNGETDASLGMGGYLGKKVDLLF